jgi:hypothetical protein
LSKSERLKISLEGEFWATSKNSNFKLILSLNTHTHTQKQFGVWVLSKKEICLGRKFPSSHKLKNSIEFEFWATALYSHFKLILSLKTHTFTLKLTLILFHTLSRPEKSLHLLINNPVTSLHIFLNPEYRLHLFYRMKRKRALLRSNSPGIIQSDEHINPLLGLHLIMDLLFICTSAKPNKTYAIATSSFFCLLIW